MFVCNLLFIINNNVVVVASVAIRLQPVSINIIIQRE